MQRDGYMKNRRGAYSPERRNWRTRAAPSSIRFSFRLGPASLMTTERVRQDLHDAPCDYIKLDLSAAE
jgi:hypothetical protein